MELDRNIERETRREKGIHWQREKDTQGKRMREREREREGEIQILYLSPKPLQDLVGYKHGNQVHLPENLYYFSFQ